MFGYSLTELVLVTGLLSVLLTSAAAKPDKLFAKSESESLALEINQLILRAARYSRDHTIFFTEQSYTINNHSQHLHSKLSITSKSDNKIYIYGSGSCSPASINLQSANQSCQLVLSLRCRTRIQCI